MAPSDTTTEPNDAPLAAPKSLLVRVASGPDAGAEQKLSRDGGRVLVGTSETCALKLKDRLVSRRHLALEITRGGLLVRDLGSTNGTFVRGIRIREATLPQGEALLVGSTQLVAVDAERVDEPALELADVFGRIIGQTFEMRRLFAIAKRLAASDVPVLIEGETGTGKELLAEEMHRESARAAGPLVVFDALTDDPHGGAIALLGAAPGIYPGLPDGRVGLLEQARGGTLLIDEPAELNPDLQRRLARALERREVVPMGAEESRKLDLRIITTSSVDLDRAVERGAFREDLFFSLVGARVELPPLRNRADDIPELAAHFWTAAGAPGSPPERLVERLRHLRWPGNVRELENAVARHLATGELDVTAQARASQTPPPAPPEPPGGTDIVSRVLAQRLPLARARQEVVVAFEQLYVDQVLRDHAGNVTRAAKASGLAHRYFQALKAKRTK